MAAYNCMCVCTLAGSGGHLSAEGAQPDGLLATSYSALN